MESGSGRGVDGLLVLSEDVAVGIDLGTGTVDVALYEQTQHGVHGSVVGNDVGIVRCDGVGDELGNAHLLHVGVVAESTLDVLHVRASAGENESAQQLVGILGRHLIPHVLDYFGQSRLDNLDKLAALHRALLVDGEAQGVVDVAVVGEGTAILELHLLGIALLHLQGSNVLGDVVTAERNDSQVAQHVLVVDRDGGGVGSEVYEHASSALLGLAEHAVGQCQRSQIHLADGYASLVEAVVEVVVESLSPEDVEEIAFETAGLDAYGVELILVVDLVFLCCGIEDFLLRIRHIAVGIHEFVDHLGRDNGLVAQFLDNHIAHAAYGLASHSHVDVCYLALQLVFQLGYYIGKTLACLIDVIHDSLTDALRSIFLNHGQHGDAAVEVLASGNARNLR